MQVLVSEYLRMNVTTDPDNLSRLRFKIPCRCSLKADVPLSILLWGHADVATLTIQLVQNIGQPTAMCMS